MEGFSWNDFFSKNEDIAINVQNLEEEHELFELFNKHGLLWCIGEVYDSERRSVFKAYKNRTCYSNIGTFGSIDQYKENNFKIYKYEDVKKLLNEHKGIFEWLCS